MCFGLSDRISLLLLPDADSELEMLSEPELELWSELLLEALLPLQALLTPCLQVYWSGE